MVAVVRGFTPRECKVVEVAKVVGFETGGNRDVVVEAELKESDGATVAVTAVAFGAVKEKLAAAVVVAWLGTTPEAVLFAPNKPPRIGWLVAAGGATVL